MITTKNSLINRFFARQGWQISILTTLFISFYYTYALLGVPQSQWLGITTRDWYLMAIVTPVIHQIFVWLCWRGELYFKALSNVFGKNAFRVYFVLFFLLIFIRFFSIFAICFADCHSLKIYASVRYPLALILHFPALYAMYSVARYFGMTRACGEDHFKPDEYRNKSFVRQGMYKYTANVMYVYVGLIFLATAILCASKAGLLVSIYFYATVWTHYFCTEKPDIKYIYN